MSAKLLNSTELAEVLGRSRWWVTCLKAEWLNRVAVVSTERDQLRVELANANARSAEWARIVDDRNAQLAEKRAELVLANVKGET